MWKEKLKLEDGEELRPEGRADKGTMGQTEVERYSVVRDGQVVGSVQYTEHMSIKAPFKQSMHLVQRRGGEVVVDERWNA